jgi:hypothetical protein
MKITKVAFTLVLIIFVASASPAWAQTETHCKSGYDDSVNCTTKAAPNSDTALEAFDKWRHENRERRAAAEAARVQREQAAQAAAKAEQVTIAAEKRAEERQIAAEKRADERAAKAVPPAAPVAQIVIVPVAQPQTVNGTAAPEVSVAEAARQARITKVVREAKEKAERDNPPPPQQ